MTASGDKEILVYIGTYTGGDSEGIYVYKLDLSCGSLEYSSKIAGVDNPSFLAMDPAQRYLYAVNEQAPDGRVSAFAIDPDSGALSFLNQQPSGGSLPCYLVVDQSGKFVLLSNYGSGSLAVFSIEDDGRLGALTDLVRHQGSSVDAERQQGPHAHCVVFDRSGRHAFSADLGADEVKIYHFDATAGKLRPGNPPSVETEPGVGPRHFTFHPGGKFAYLINELGSTMSAFTYDETKGMLAQIQTLSTLPQAFTGYNHSADLHLEPSGKFLYGSNRGHDSIAIYGIDESSGRLTHIGNEPTRGGGPRNFAIDPSGTFLLAANHDSDNVVTFRLDRKSGKLEATGHVARVPAPVCLKMTYTTF